MTRTNKPRREHATSPEEGTDHGQAEDAGEARGRDRGREGHTGRRPGSEAGTRRSAGEKPAEPARKNGASTLSDAEFARMVALIKKSDSVELKLTIPDTEHRSAIVALDLDPLEAEIRQVVFFDTPDLTLDEHGVVVRARRVQGKGDDSVVKLRPVVPSEMPPRSASRRRSGSRSTRCPAASSAPGR